jgi:hypothetical protein
VLILPAAAGAYVGAQVLVAIANSLTPVPEVVEIAYSQVVNSVVGPLAFVYVGAKLAPRHQFVTALGLTVLHAVAITTIVTAALVSGRNGQPAWVLIGAAGLGIVATVILCYHLRERPAVQGSTVRTEYPC